MRKKELLSKVLLLLAVMVAGVGTAWAETTYKLEKVTSVKDGGLYVFEQDGHVMGNTITSSALQTTDSYSTTGLKGTETYIWKLEASGNDFKMMNVSLKEGGDKSAYLDNTTKKTDLTWNTGGANWSFTYQTNDGSFLIQNTGNSNRFLGYTSATSYAYKAYATSNLSSYPHAIVVYELVEETASEQPAVAAPTFSVPAGAVKAPTTLELTQSDADMIMYTTDGSDPDYENNIGELYSETDKIIITNPCTIKAIAIDADENVSSVASATYTINVVAPTFSVEAGKVASGTTVELSADGAELIIFTTNGTEPSYIDNIGEVYTEAIELTEDLTIKAIAVDTYDNESAVVSATYSVVAAGTTVATWNAGNTTAITTPDKGFQLNFDDEEVTAYYLKDSSTTDPVSNDAEIRVYKSSQMTFSVPTGGTISEIVFTCVSASYATALSKAKYSTGEVSVSGTIVTWTGSTESLTIDNDDAQVRISKIELTYVSAPAKAVATPTFSVESGSYLEAQSVTIACETDGAEIYYTLDGTTPTKESTKYTGAINVSETTTINAIAYKGDDDSMVATVTLTFPTVYQTIAALIAANPSEESYLKMTDAQVYYVNGDNMYIGDASASLCFYKCDLSYTAGQRLNGTVKVSYKLYKNLPEVTKVSENNLTATNGEVTSVVMDIADVDASNASTLVEVTGTIESVTPASGNTKDAAQLTDGNSNEVKLYDNFGTDLLAELKEGNNVVVKGIVIVYNDDLEIAPISLSVTQGTESITIGETGYMTYANTTSAVSFNATGVKAYVAAYNAETGSVKLAEVNEIPANTAVVLEAAAGDYDLYLTNETIAQPENNDLQVSAGKTVSAEENIFCLAKGNKGVGFYRVNAGVEIPAGKAYLEIPATGRQFIGFDSAEAQGISDIVRSAEGSRCYNLSGQRIAAPQKGLYIVNGKKIVK